MTNLDMGAVMVSGLTGELGNDLKLSGTPAVLGVCSPLSAAELGDWWGPRSHRGVPAACRALLRATLAASAPGQCELEVAMVMGGAPASPGEALRSQRRLSSNIDVSRQGPSWGIFMHPASPAAGMRGDIPAHRKGMPESLHRC